MAGVAAGIRSSALHGAGAGPLSSPSPPVWSAFSTGDARPVAGAASFVELLSVLPGLLVLLSVSLLQAASIAGALDRVMLVSVALLAVHLLPYTAQPRFVFVRAHAKARCLMDSLGRSRQVSGSVADSRLREV